MQTHTLLLVEDSPTIQQEIRSALVDEPIQIVVAVNGHQALDRIEATRPDVVLASTTALGVNGYGLAHYVSQRPSLSNVAVLLLATTVNPDDTYRMTASGARGLICHPIEPGIVRARIKEVLMLSGPVIGEADALGELTTAFDAIDASMTSQVSGGKTQPNEIAITPDALAKMVNDAVTQAIAAYEQERGLAPGPARDSTTGGGQHPPVAPPSPEQTTQQQLQHEMGLDDIAFAWAPPTPPRAASVVDTDLATQIGVDDFAFGVEDLPPRQVAPDTFAAPPSVPSEIHRGDQATDATTVLEPLRDAVVLLGTALADQASRFRPARAQRARPRPEERAEAVPAEEPAAAPEPAAPIVFTFDPIPPVPPPVPRGPRED